MSNEGPREARVFYVAGLLHCALSTHLTLFEGQKHHPVSMISWIVIATVLFTWGILIDRRAAAP